MEEDSRHCFLKKTCQGPSQTRQESGLTGWGDEMRMTTGPEIDPEDLLLGARRGGREALGKLLEFYRHYLHLLARTQVDLHLQRRASPSDLVQETLLDAVRDFPRFSGSTEGDLLAWLRRILLHNVGRLIEREVTARKRSVRPTLW